MKNLALLETFAAVGRLGSFSRAADSLGIPKSTVSRRIKALEEELGVSLIHRDPRHFELTDQGIALLNRTEVLLHEAEEAFDEVRSIQTGLRGTIIISTTADLALLYLTKALSSFSILNSHLRFNIDVNPRVVDLISEKVDLAIRVGSLTDSGLTARKLHEQQPGFFATPDYLARRGRPKSVSEFTEHSLIATSKLNIGETVVTPSIQANSMSMVKDLTLNGAGIGLMAEHFVYSEKKTGKLVQILSNRVLPKVPIFLVFPNRKLSKRVEGLVSEILKLRGFI